MQSPNLLPHHSSSRRKRIPRSPRNPQNNSEDEAIIVIQTEDEIAAINSASGAAIAGARAATSTSGPGFSLMVEGLSWAGNSEVPVVVTYYQRGAPATGLTHTAWASRLALCHACRTRRVPSNNPRFRRHQRMLLRRRQSVQPRRKIPNARNPPTRQSHGKLQPNLPRFRLRQIQNRPRNAPYRKRSGRQRIPQIPVHRNRRLPSGFRWEQKTACTGTQETNTTRRVT